MMYRGKQKKQKGAIIVMFTIALFAILAFAALALDSSHLLLNKSRLQNYVDSAALSAAKIIDDGGNHAAARAAAIEAMNINLAHPDAQEIAANFDISNMTVSFFYHPEDTLAAPETDETAKFVKVQVSDVDLSNFLAGILNFDKGVSANALAGASTPIQYCFRDLLPMLVCGSSEGYGDDDYLFGFNINDLHVLKMDSSPDPQIGPGNFQLLRLGDSNGANEIRKAMAGGDNDASELCFASGDEPPIGTTSSVPTEPGNTVGPVAQGLNTRFGEYDGNLAKDSHLYPHDENVCQGERVELDDSGEAYLKGTGNTKIYARTLVTPDDPELSPYYVRNDAFYSLIYTHDDYQNETQECLPTSPPKKNQTFVSRPERREVRVVVGVCDGKTNGSNIVDFLGVACFFLTQTNQQKGNESYVVGEFMNNCTGNGWPSGDTSAHGPHTLVLYHVPSSSDS